ncbi:MAG TPA: nuclear transport factor 2 family protein [Gemmatimonadaceae bacterium]|nr:nuclear transport factor 2 family protein [Gemmatimonadaceae bacterium]
MTDEQALTIANEWIAAWNSHDIDRILSHYSDDVELTSALVSGILGPGQDTVRGKPALRAYFLRALEAFPDLTFDFWGAYPGHESVIVHYESVRRLRAAEFMRVDSSGRVNQVVAHYASPAPTA